MKNNHIIIRRMDGKWLVMLRPQHIIHLGFVRKLGFYWTTARVGKDCNWVKLEK